MERLIDIHQHVVYGLDDGPADFAAATPMLDAAAREGVVHIIATPHIAPGLRDFDDADFRARLDALNAYCEKQAYALRVLGGSEILYSEASARLLQARRLPTMNGSRFILVEWPVDVRYEALFAAVRDLSNAGFFTILAHVERYRCLERDVRLVEELKTMFDVRVQVNCGSVLRKRPPWGVRRFVTALLNAGLIDYFASDAHNTDSRPINLLECRRRLAERFDEDCATRLTYSNQLELLA